MVWSAVQFNFNILYEICQNAPAQNAVCLKKRTMEYSTKETNKSD